MGRPPASDAPKPFTPSLSLDDLTEYIARQMDALFADGFPVRPQLNRYVAAALERMEHCIMRVALKGFHTKDGPRYHPCTPTSTLSFSITFPIPCIA